MLLSVAMAACAVSGPEFPAASEVHEVRLRDWTAAGMPATTIRDPERIRAFVAALDSLPTDSWRRCPEHWERVQWIFLYGTRTALLIGPERIGVSNDRSWPVPASCRDLEPAALDALLAALGVDVAAPSAEAR